MNVSSLHIPANELFNLMCRNAKVGCWVLNLQNNQLWWSDSYCEMLGREDKNESQLFEDFLDNTVHPEDRYLVTASVKKHLHQRQSSDNYEIRLKSQTGNYNWYETVSHTQYDEENKIQFILSGVINIDEKKKYQEESKKLKLIVDVAEEMMGIGTFESNFITGERYWSKAIYDITELPFNTPITSLVREIFYDEKDLKTLTKAVTELQEEKKPVDVEVRMITAKKNALWIRMMAQPVIENYKVVGMRGTIQKIEKQKLKENFLIDIRNRIKEQKFFLDETSTMSNVGGWEVDLVNNTFYWSNQTKLIHEVDEDFDPSFDASLQFYTPASREFLLDHFVKLLDASKPYDLELEVITAKKNKIWVRSIGKPVMDDMKNIIKVRGVIQNITEQKLKEIELNEALSIINGQNEKLKNFTYIVSHNLRSHSGNLKMITEMVELETDAEVKLQWIDLIKKVSTSLNETVNNLTGLVNLSIENKTRISFTALFDNIQKTLSYKLRNEDVQIITDFSACEFVDYVPAYLESIMFNLVTNAIKYKHPERKSVISLCTGFKNERPYLEVKDNGLGIDMDMYGSRLFKMNQTFHQNADARGIGLYITKNQVENMGGSIEVDSVVNEGTTFTIHFQVQNNPFC